MGKTPVREPSILHLISSCISVLSLPFPEFCFATTGEVARPISGSQVGECIGPEAAVTSGLRLYRT